MPLQTCEGAVGLAKICHLHPEKQNSFKKRIKPARVQQEYKCMSGNSSKINSKAKIFCE